MNYSNICFVVAFWNVCQDTFDLDEMMSVSAKLGLGVGKGHKEYLSVLLAHSREVDLTTMKHKVSVAMC